MTWRLEIKKEAPSNYHVNFFCYNLMCNETRASFDIAKKLSHFYYYPAVKIIQKKKTNKIF